VEILNYTEDHLRFRERVRSFFEKEVTPHVDEWEKSGITPKSIWKRMGEEGFLCTSVPKEIGRAHV
jgi:acyl-CoA dehydrogenase